MSQKPLDIQNELASVTQKIVLLNSNVQIEKEVNLGSSPTTIPFDGIPQVNKNITLIKDQAQMTNTHIKPSTKSPLFSTAVPSTRSLIPESSGEITGYMVVISPLIVTVLGTLFLTWFLRSFLCICRPNEIVVLSGRKWQTKDGRELGFRVICGGRVLRIPFLETVKRMNVTTMPVRLEVKNAYSKGGIPLHIQAIANIKISSDVQIVGNAIERFLDHKKEEIIRVAQETLEGKLRGVVATLTPEQVNEDRLQFAERIASDISQDLQIMGLQLDTLKVLNVSDDVEYLSSIGRQRIAMILRDAEVAESEALSAAEVIEAECEEQSCVAKTNDQATVIERENELRKIKAKLDKAVFTEQALTHALTKERKAKIEQELYVLRTTHEQLRLQADKILPAEAQRTAQELQAQGQAAYSAESVKAEAMVNDLLSEVWKELGSNASTMFLIQQLETILQEAATVPKHLKLQNVHVVDSGDGQAIASLLQIYPQTITDFLKAAESTLGINVPLLLKKIGDRPQPSLSPETNLAQSHLTT